MCVCVCTCVYLCFVSAVHARIFWAQFVAQCPRIHKQGDSDSRQLATPSQGPRLVATCTGLPCAAVAAAAAMCFFLIFSLLFHAFLFVFADMYECVAYPRATPPSLSLSLCATLASVQTVVIVLSYCPVACVRCMCLRLPASSFSLLLAIMCLLLSPLAYCCLLLSLHASIWLLLPPLATTCHL